MSDSPIGNPLTKYFTKQFLLFGGRHILRKAQTVQWPFLPPTTACPSCAAIETAELQGFGYEPGRLLVRGKPNRLTQLGYITLFGLAGFTLLMVGDSIFRGSALGLLFVLLAVAIWYVGIIALLRHFFSRHVIECRACGWIASAEAKAAAARPHTPRQRAALYVIAGLVLGLILSVNLVQQVHKMASDGIAAAPIASYFDRNSWWVFAVWLASGGAGYLISRWR